MSRIIEKIVEPTKIYVGSTFKLKIKVQDDYLQYRQIITENDKILITEDGKRIITEWSE